jgi:hypothetical protein
MDRIDRGFEDDPSVYKLFKWYECQSETRNVRWGSWVGKSRSGSSQPSLSSVSLTLSGPREHLERSESGSSEGKT